MPSTISFLPASAPAPATAPSATPSGQPSGDSNASFDSALTQAEPSSAKSPGQHSTVTGPARTSADAEQTLKAEKTAKAAKGSELDAEAGAADKSLLSAQELAALLAMIGAPVALQPPPPPAVPADFNPAGDTRTPDSADVSVECKANFSAPQFAATRQREVCVAAAPGARQTNTPGVFSLETANVTGENPSARDLLKEGAEFIDYQLQPSLDAGAPAAVPGEQPATAPITAPVAYAKASAPLAPASVLGAETVATPATVPGASRMSSSAAIPISPATLEPAAVAQQAAAAPAQSVEAASVRRVSASHISPRKTSVTGASEKIAASNDSRLPSDASGVKSSIESNKNNFLSVGNKQLKQDVAPVGTDAANWGDSMNPDARSTPFVARLIDGALSLLGTSPAGTTPMDRSSETARASTVSPAQATQIVNEIRDIADGLWAVERNSVEVRFHFSEHERLSVKVEYRDGVVQTTFRTDSPELRDTIAREWQVQVATASDARPYRVADPVFNTPPADARGFSLGGDSSRQQRQAEQSAGGAAHTFATTSGRGQSSSSPSVAAAPATALTRPDTALHLHAFA